MRATVMHKARDVRVENVPDAAIQKPTEALSFGFGNGLTGCVTASSRDAPSRSSGLQFRSLR
jgi:hypothetical protein